MNLTWRGVLKPDATPVVAMRQTVPLKKSWRLMLLVVNYEISNDRDNFGAVEVTLFIRPKDSTVRVPCLQFASTAHLQRHELMGVLDAGDELTVEAVGRHHTHPCEVGLLLSIDATAVSLV